MLVSRSWRSYVLRSEVDSQRLIGINIDDDALIGSLIGQEDGIEMTEHQSATVETVRSCLQATPKTPKVVWEAFEE